MAFAVVHVLLLLVTVAWAIVSFIQGNVVRGVLVVGALAVYYWAVLHAPVKKEIERLRQVKKEKDHP